ncbi:TetR/AcrR family transcriptional regulator [Nocardia sp. NPDC051750]|uniref:TetR/AcrR family transcriptional regulator n=1 Tax=Nocardia sp. NPDC051750 TaxID=3364325 RepID=UPI0037B8578A
MTADNLSARAIRVTATRDAILIAAERLFAELGVNAVSNRQVSEAAGQGNNAAVGYHFGTKADLVLAIVRKHQAHTERLCRERVARVRASASPQVRDWVECLVRPVTEHLGSLGHPTWYARFVAQLMADPAYRRPLTDESLSSRALRCVIEGLQVSMGHLPADLRRERNIMASLLIVHSCAERERALAAGETDPAGGWELTATRLVDAITGLYLAPATA